MDGAIPGSGSESIRKLPTSSPLAAFRSGASQSRQGVHAGLFEQLLSMPAPAPVQRSRADSESSGVSASAAPEISKDAPAANQEFDTPAENRPVSLEDEEGERETVEDQLPLVNSALPAAPPASPQTEPEATDLPTTPEQDQIDKPILAEGDAEDNAAAAGEPAIVPEAVTGPATPDVVETGPEAPEKAELSAGLSSHPPQATADGQQSTPRSDTAADLPPEVIEDHTLVGPDMELAPEENLGVEARGAEQPNLDEVAVATPEAGDQQYRGGKRAKGNERRSAHTPAKEGASKARFEATGVSSPSAQATGQAATVEPPTHDGAPPASPMGPTPPVTTTNLVMPADTPLIANFIASTAPGGTPPAQAAAPMEGGDATTAVTRAVELARPATRSSGPEAKAAAADAQQTDNLTQAERVRLVQRISRSFARLGPSGGAINIKLHPPQLGSLNVQVKMEGRTMTAKLSTESAAAREVILESLPVLRGRLAEQGFEIASFQVEVADNNADAANLNQQQSSDHSSSEDGRSGRQVDYRRLAAMQRQQGEGTVVAAAAAVPAAMAWQSLAHMDLQA